MSVRGHAPRRTSLYATVGTSVAQRLNPANAKGPASTRHDLSPATVALSSRLVYRIDESTRTVHVLDIDHRSEIHRPHQ
jgi:hypothetical protein